jgi:hypothetical protein
VAGPKKKLDRAFQIVLRAFHYEVGFVRGFLATVAIVCCSATAALAAVDMNGAWF